MPKVVKEVEKSLLEEKVKLEDRRDELAIMFKGYQSEISKIFPKLEAQSREANAIQKRLQEIDLALNPKEEAPKNENAS